MATSKGRNNPASKPAAGKKSAASNSSSKSTGASSGTGKTTASARGGASSSSTGKASGSGIKSQGNARSGAASKSTASKSTASKSTASKATGSKSTASKSTALKSTGAKSTASRNGGAVKSATGRGTAAKSSAGSNGAASRSTSARATSSSAKNAKAGDARNDLEKILQDLMKDIYYAEKKLTKALGKMARNATDPKLKEAFTTHQAQTEDQVSQLEKAFGVLGMTPKAKKCAAMDGLLEEANEHIEEYAKGAGLDAALIVGAQKVEHYEIAAYGSMRSFARTLGYSEAATIFEEIREQESDTDELLTTLAESVINPKAEEEAEDVSQSAKSASGGNGDSAGGRAEGMEAAGESGSRSSADNGNGREGGDDAMAGEGGSAISGMTDGNNREGASETGEAMGY